MKKDFEKVSIDIGGKTIVLASVELKKGYKLERK